MSDLKAPVHGWARGWVLGALGALLFLAGAVALIGDIVVISISRAGNTADAVCQDPPMAAVAGMVLATVGIAGAAFLLLARRMMRGDAGLGRVIVVGFVFTVLWVACFGAVLASGLSITGCDLTS